MLLSIFIQYTNEIQMSEMPEQTSIQIENNYFMSLLQQMDNLKLDKNIQYQVISLLKGFSKEHSDFIFHPFNSQYVLGSIKIILQKFQFQQAADIYGVSDQIIQDLSAIQLFSDQYPTPYDLLVNLKNNETINMKTFMNIKFVLDYFLTFSEAYTSSASDVLDACIATCHSLNESFEGPNKIVLNLSERSQQLKQLICLGLEQDLEP